MKLVVVQKSISSHRKFKHIAILVPAVAKSFHVNASKFVEKKASVQQSIKIIAEIVVKMNILAHNKSCSKLKNSTSEIGYYSYTNRQTAQ